MAVDKTFLIKSIQKKEEFIVAYCQYTNMPLIVCDPETFNDQIWMFDTEAQLQEFAKEYIDKKILLRGVKYPNKAFLGFFSMLFTIGINELVFVGENGKETIELEHLVKRPDFSQLPKQQQPILNPELQLTGLYFMQEASRPIPMEQKTLLPELEEELTANLYKSRYLMPIELNEGDETDVEKLQKGHFRPMVVKNKQDETAMFQVLFTDPNEMAKLNKDKKYRALTVPFKNLSKLLVKESKGFMLNPAGFHIAMPIELLKRLEEEFSEEE